MQRSKGNKVRLAAGLLFAAICIVIVIFLYINNVIPHRSYDDAHFGIAPYVSRHDQDGDGMDDQTEILSGARAYVAKKPRYESRYYEGGYPNDGYGVCTDVVGAAFLAAGYDLQQLVDEDIADRPFAYDIVSADRNIDFRRVRNLKVYFEAHADALTTDIRQIDQWQGGDIVVFEGHIGIVSDKRNKFGIPFVIHHSGKLQFRYEEDILPWRNDIVGHYRVKEK